MCVTSLLAPLLTLHIRIHMCVEFTLDRTTDEFTLESKLDYSSTLYTTLQTTPHTTLYIQVERGWCSTVEAHSQISVEAPLSTLCVCNRRIVVHGVQNG